MGVLPVASPRSVIHHAMASGECRDLFPLHRLPDTNEIWFRDYYHSDVGGSNGNIGLNMTDLCWMIDQAKESGLQFNSRITTEYRSLRNARALPKPPMDLIVGAAREILCGDCVYE